MNIFKMFYNCITKPKLGTPKYQVYLSLSRDVLVRNIKVYREITGSGLNESKCAIEKVLESGNTSIKVKLCDTLDEANKYMEDTEAWLLKKGYNAYLFSVKVQDYL
jgi:ribosomal protein L7/L12